LKKHLIPKYIIDATLVVVDDIAVGGVEAAAGEFEQLYGGSTSPISNANETQVCARVFKCVCVCDLA